MTMAELIKCTDEELNSYKMHFAETGNYKALGIISDVEKYKDKTVKVVKGRKVPIGTTGKVFWMGCNDYSKYGDPWGIYTKTRIGIKDTNGDAHFTSVDNVEIIAE